MVAIDPAVKDWLEAASFVATFLGIPFAIFLFLRERKREEIARQEMIYLTPNQQYLDYLKLCLEHPELDIYDLVSPGAQTPQDVKREWIAFNIVISIMEQAFLLYQNHPKSNNRQWAGWQDYMRWWMARANFRRAWDTELSQQFDTDFVAFMNSLPPYQPSPYELSYAWMDPEASHDSRSSKPEAASPVSSKVASVLKEPNA